MAPAGGSTTTTNANKERALAKLVLPDSPTSVDMQVFCIKFGSLLPQDQANRNKQAFNDDDYNPGGATKRALDVDIYENLIGCMPEALNTDMLTMTQECGQKGPSCLRWLNER